MGGVLGGLLGTAGGASGTGFSGPTAGNVQQPVTSQMATDQYNNVLANQTQQNNFANAVLGQNGLQNQTSVFNQLQGIANGTGPNPAKAMLNQATGANTANQAALMAGQRGSNANVGMIARQAAQQGGMNQQNAAAQGATMQANQSLNAMNQLGGIAGQQVGQAQGAISAANQASQAEQGNLLNAIGAQNNANVGMQSNINSGNAGLANTTMQGQQALVGGLLNSIGPAAKLFASGGAVQYAEGGPTSGPQSSIGQFLTTVASPGAPQVSMSPLQSPDNPGAAALKKGASGMSMPSFGGGSGFTGKVAGGPDTSEINTGNLAAKGGEVKALLSPGEKYLEPKDVKKVEQGKNPMQVGKTVPGTPKVGGAKNDYANDTVAATLKEGGVILPRSVTKSKNPGHEAKKFVDAVLARKGRK